MVKSPRAKTLSVLKIKSRDTVASTPAPAILSTALHLLRGSQACLPAEELRGFIGCDHGEFHRIVKEFGEDAVFASKGRKRTAPPRVQIGVALRRLATGTTLKELKKTFGLPNGSIEGYTQHTVSAIAKRLHQHVKWPDAQERVQIGQRIFEKFALPGCAIQVNIQPSTSALKIRSEDSKSGDDDEDDYEYNLLVVLGI
ncbi:hypothetical protein L198_04547 [Cryptococcus wingfieldii CBS 7118]|uniref:Transposase Helix-turn-helix domain-containing protein n=1 Tax=Cryptococcus wingfieldii CBS 7118 TaxID=1295528 RepID=A0A1E3J4Y5_9TREE|nr:hypothetical protein L198_04547 [Cryptococcus wingfieldii CBS 7118]ODN95928.1 hypothetical protein L198_04547 [Cryptococcus wingfieldii CBS 7118]